MNRSIKTNGAEISYQRVGDGPAVLLVQGAGIVGEGWRPQIEALRHEYTLYAFDNRGIGKSALDKKGTISIAAMANDALAIMDAEQVESFHVVGHSMGGLIAQALALKARARVRSLSLLCSFVRGAQGAEIQPAARDSSRRRPLRRVPISRTWGDDPVRGGHQRTTQNPFRCLLTHGSSPRRFLTAVLTLRRNHRAEPSCGTNQS